MMREDLHSVDIHNISPSHSPLHRLLTNTQITTLHAAFQACKLIHLKGVRVVVIKSLDSNVSGPDHIDIVASALKSSGELPEEYIHLRVPRLGGYLSGTGDLTSALLLARLQVEGVERLVGVVEKT